MTLESICKRRKRSGPLVLFLFALVSCGSEDLGGPADHGGADAAALRDQRGDLAQDTSTDRIPADDRHAGEEVGGDAAPGEDATLGRVDGVAPDVTADAVSDASPPDAQPPETGPDANDGSTEDARVPDALAGDGATLDAGAADAPGAPQDGSPKDGASNDGSPNDGSSKDGSVHTPCTRGPGWVAWRFHYNPNEPGTQAHLDVYDLLDSSNWEANPVFSTSIVDSIHGGGLEIASGNWILIRYSVAGLMTIRSATFSVNGRSYSVSASGSFNAWTPLYGDAPSPTNSVSNAWPYTWTSIDFTGHVRAGDTPGLTGIRLYAGPSSNDLAIHAVELCLDAD